MDSVYGVGNEVWDNTSGRGDDASAKLAGEYDLWAYVYEGSLLDNDKFGETNFNALPGGYLRISSPYNFSSSGSQAYFWTSSSGPSDRPFVRLVCACDPTVYRFEDFYRAGFSLRCVK